jgi:hypothetical protein
VCPLQDGLYWLDLAEGRLRLARLCFNGGYRLSSPAGCAGIPREARKSSTAIRRFALALMGEAPLAFGRPIAIETAMVRARKQ